VRRAPTGLAILALTAGLLVGCGGGDDDVATALRDGEAPDDGGGDDNRLTDGDDRSSGDDDDNPMVEAAEGDDGDDRDAEGDAVAFCLEAADVEERLAAIEDSEAPTPDQLAEVSDAFSDLAARAPDDVAEDMRSIAGALTALGDAFGRIDIEDPESLEALEEESARLEEEFGDLEAAGENVETYLKEECGIDLGGDAALPGDEEETGRDGDGTGAGDDREG
jgi:hypothetical protein